MNSLLKNIAFALGLAVIVFLGYTVFLKDDGSETLSAEDALFRNQASVDAQEFLIIRHQLDAIQFDRALFSDLRFRSLLDLRQDVVEEPVGRSNPFAEIGG